MGRRRPLRPLKQALETALLRALAAFARLLPLEAASDTGARLGAIARRVLGRRRRIAETNLRAALGLSEQEAARITGEVFAQIGRSFLEFLSLPAKPPEEMERRVALDGGFARLEAHHASGRGAILVTAHYGNWEWFGAVAARRFGGMAYVFPAQSNPGADAFLNAARRRLGVDLIPMEGGLRPAMKRLRAGGNLGMLADQDARRLGIHVPFFGRPASTLTGPARLAIRAGVPVFVAVLDRVAPARFQARTLAWIEPAEGADEEADVRRITTEIAAAVEGAARRRPDHWYWIHRRWKTPPPAGTAAAAGEAPTR